MASEVIPVVDLRLLSQADLNTLSLSSPNAFDLRRCDDVVVPKIDRSVFNESAGSRKQTYSRLRLAPRKPDAPPSSSSATSVARRRSRTILSATPTPSAAAPNEDDPCRRENQKIVSFLRKLFYGEDSTPIPAPAQSQGQTLTLTAPLTGSMNAEEASKALVLVGDRVKEEASNALVLVDDKDMEILNVKGITVDLLVLGKKDAPFGEELRRRTVGMRTEEEILGFLTGLAGQWGSRRRKRKIVDAAGFGDDLPRGWKLLLGLRRKEGIVRLDCRRYVSPNGKQFISCKDVASYILSLVGDQDARQLFSGQNGSGTPSLAKLTPGYAAGPTHQADNSTCSSRTPISSFYAGHGKQDVLSRVEMQDMIELKNTLQCHKCNLAFGDKDALVQHLFSFHQSVKRRRLGKSIGDGVIIKDGKYECQFCHKTFSERHRYNGHIGAHVRYQGLSAETLPAVVNPSMIINPTPLAAVPFSGMNVLSNKDQESCTAKAVDNLLVGSSNCRLQMENHEIDPNAKYGATGTSEVTCTSKSDDQINNCDLTCDNSEEIAEACKITSIQSNAFVTTISPSMIDINSASQDSSCNFSQEVSMSKPVDDQINDFDMNGHRSAEAIEDSSVRDIKPNECLNTISPAITNVDNATCETVTENGLHSSMSQTIDDIVGCDMIGYKSEEMVDTSNATCMEPSSCLDALSPSLINLDSMTHDAASEIDLSSCTMISGIEKYNEVHKVDTEDNLLLVLDNGSNYGVETYSNNIFTNTVEEHELVKMDTSSNELKNDLGSFHVLSNKDAVMGNTMLDELHTSCGTPFGSGHTGAITTDADCASHSFMKLSVLEEMNKPGNELENCFHTRNAEDDASVFNGNNGRNQLHVSVVTTSWGQSIDSLPVLDMIPDRSEEELSVVGQKHDDLSGLEELRLDGTQPFEFVLLAGQESGSTPKPTDELGYVAELEGDDDGPLAQSEWDMPSPSMVGRCDLGAVCVWCGSELSRESTTAELELGSVGFMCSACKQKISGPLDAADNDLSG